MTGTPPSAVDVDVLVAGGGPVGLAAAIEARLQGFDVVLVEPRADPVDKACGEGLMPGAVAALTRIGVDPPGRDLAGIRYTDGRRESVHRFRTGPGRGVRRTTLHACLAERADALGVKRVAGRVEDVAQGDGYVAAGGLRARWLLGCDGLHSPLRRRLGLAAGSDGRRYGLRRHYRVPAWTDLVEVHWSPTVEAYVTPVADDVVGVAVLGPPRTPYDSALAGVPALAARLRGAEPLGGVRGAGPLRQRVRSRVAGRVLLVGDAGGYVDALTGEGLRVGLAQSRAAVGCLVAEDPAAYERQWRAVTRDYRWLTSGLVAVASRPRGRRAVVPAAAALPAVFAAAVESLAG